MKKRILALTTLIAMIINLCSCTLLKKPLDKKSNLSNVLKQTEDYIRNDDWDNAKTSLKNSQNIWKNIKPLLQIDVDHDYVNDVEKEFTKLNGYLDTKHKSESLASILLIQETWDDIGSL